MVKFDGVYGEVGRFASVDLRYCPNLQTEPHGKVGPTRRNLGQPFQVPSLWMDIVSLPGTRLD